MRIGILFVLILLAGCTGNINSFGVQKSNEDKISLEQYFYSESEEKLNKLHERLVAEGYKVSEQISYKHNGKTEWSFYSIKEVSRHEISNEDLKSENYAKQFEVKYDGHGFSLEN
jgi:hypothetical protein